MTTDSQPTPEQIAHDVMRTIDGAKYHDIDTPDVIAILAALRDAGYAVVKLPEPVQTFSGSEDENAWSAWLHDGIEVVAFQDGEVHFQGQVLDDPGILAAALLAAADAAERGES
ncbi:hypothetical protein [uncultured Gordonia sp.]|uniref:hypothetical protein n=1 Tax=uncultured Gordonia sp. TaxID=198437 RepID=UPI0025870040|nr:hypothetical protein [uncultured Gordonia sp.]